MKNENLTLDAINELIKKKGLKIKAQYEPARYFFTFEIEKLKKSKFTVETLDELLKYVEIFEESSLLNCKKEENQSVDTVETM